jgi:hypothetical protein
LSNLGTSRALSILPRSAPRRPIYRRQRVLHTCGAVEIAPTKGESQQMDFEAKQNQQPPGEADPPAKN